MKSAGISAPGLFAADAFRWGWLSRYLLEDLLDVLVFVLFPFRASFSVFPPAPRRGEGSARRCGMSALCTVRAHCVPVPSGLRDCWPSPWPALTCCPQLQASLGVDTEVQVGTCVHRDTALQAECPAREPKAAFPSEWRCSALCEGFLITQCFGSLLGMCSSLSSLCNWEYLQTA